MGRPHLFAGKTARICIAIPVKTLETIDSACDELGMARSTFIRTCVFKEAENVINRINKIEEAMTAIVGAL
jgi:metal-responsive CopG/Arc/MetJ family transcriptional regulator